jgi:hypothetical protein
VRKQESAISRVLSTTIIHLGQPSPTASSNLPGSPLGTGGADKPHTPLFGLAPGGVYRAANCYQSRGALLPHLFTLTGQAGGIFSVALSMGSRPPGVTWRLVRRSPDFPLQAFGVQRLSGQLLLSRARSLLQISGSCWANATLRSGFFQFEQTLIQNIALLTGRPGNGFGDFLVRQLAR